MSVNLREIFIIEENIMNRATKLAIDWINFLNTETEIDFKSLPEEELQNYIENLVLELHVPNSIQFDFLCFALSQIDWEQVQENIK
jgi:hypothetical protein